MSKINITLPRPPVHGKQVSFIAPCSSADATGFAINGVDYTMVDADGNPIIHHTNIWNDEAMVSVILDTENKRAYLQNPISATYQRVGETTERDSSMPTYGLE